MAQLASLGFIEVHTVGYGPDILRDEATAGRVDQRAAKLFSGAELSPEQVACMLSHEAAICWDGAKATGDWRVILEDDAIVGTDFVAFTKALSTCSLHRPSVISLFSMGRVVRTRRGNIPNQVQELGLTRLLCAPASAVGYAINNAAIEIVRDARHGKIFTRSDWPSWSGRVDFYLSDPFIVGHQTGASTMRNLPRSPSGLRRFVRAAAKALAIPFFMSPSSYRGDFSLYVRHAWLPSALFLADSIRKRVTTVGN
jgi:hypothetical protein